MTTTPGPDAETLHSDTIDSPVGSLTVVVSATGLRAVLWPDDDADRVPDVVRVDPRSTAPTAARMIIEDVARQLAEYFDGSRTEFDVPLDPVGTEFQREAWWALRQIPYGETVSYGEQADMLGDRNKARAVGAANGRNPIPIVVPCHRVVGSNGHLTGFAGGLDAKAWLLDHELTVRAAGG